jgi:Cofilin/tropomyosin-type actin-binding protein
MKHGASGAFIRRLAMAFVMLLGPGGAALAQEGFTLDPAVTEAYRQMTSSHRLTYIAFRLDDARSSIAVDSTSESDVSATPAAFELFVRTFPSRDCRSYVVDFQFKATNGDPESRVVLISWLPDGADMRSKLVLGLRNEDLRRQLPGISAYVEARTAEEASYDAVLRQIDHPYREKPTAPP